MPVVTEARPNQAAHLIALDELNFATSRRRDLLRRRLEAGQVLIAWEDGAPSGYALRGDFFGHDFLELLFVSPERRRRGLARALIANWEERRRGERLFVSTNDSNTPMQTLLATLGYAASGRVFNLDPGDAELFFVKRFDGAPLES
jgi:GNAT superfamily N-acetyltransferase